MRERGSWEKNLEGEVETEYVFVSLDLNEKPEKQWRRRISRENEEKPLRTRIGFKQSGRRIQDQTEESNGGDVDRASGQEAVAICSC